MAAVTVVAAVTVAAAADISVDISVAVAFEEVDFEAADAASGFTTTAAITPTIMAPTTAMKAATWSVGA